MTVSLLDIRFVALMGVIAVASLILPARTRFALGLGSSAALVALASVPTFAAIVGISLLYVYPMTRLIRGGAARGGGPAASRAWFVVGISGLVALMVAFKTYRFFVLPFATGSSAQRWLSVAGFSYFLFKAINVLYVHYLTDVKGSSPGSILYFALFPPTLTSGPIQRYTDFVQQLGSGRVLRISDTAEAAYRITRGYFRKLVVAYLLDRVVARLLAVEQPLVYQSLVLVACLYLFFYFDFAGYSDIAIGFGLLLGIRVPENFRRPFAATSVTEFWRNWHITLVDWFRDHVFIPAGGMRRGRFWAASLSLAIMVLCGLWHGVTPMFLSWGLWHGSLLFIEAVSGSRPMPPASRRGHRYWIRALWTNARVAFGALFFMPSLETVGRILGGFLRWW